MTMEISDIDIRDAFFDEVYNLAAKDKDVIFIAADTDAFSLRRYKQDFPGQYINIGVAEQNMIIVAAGLALSGKRVFLYAIIPFITFRCFEHIKVNLCSMNLPVTIVGVGAGLSFGYDGPTHHSVQDIAIMRILPEITILNPSDATLATACADLAYNSNSPVYVRLDKGRFPKLYNNDDRFSDGLKVIKKIADINIISTGFMTQEVLKAASNLKKYSIDVGVIDLYRLKPINHELLLKIIEGTKVLITIEDNSLVGGIGTMISEILLDNRRNIPLKRIGFLDLQIFKYGDRHWLHEFYGLDEASLTKTILEEVKTSN